MTIMAIALLLAASSETAIQIETVPGRGYSAKVATFDSPDAATVMGRVKTAAQERCAKQSVRFGRHYFDNRVDMARNVMLIENLRQSFFCFDPATDPYKPVPADWIASPTETANATVFVTRFLDRMNSGDAAGIAMMDPLIEITRADWDNLHKGAAQHRAAGNGGTLTPKLEGWSNNPEDAAYPGVYALFSVIDDHPGIAGTCGGILVQRVREGEYRISQYDVQYIGEALVQQQGLSDADLDKLCQR